MRFFYSFPCRFHRGRNIFAFVNSLVHFQFLGQFAFSIFDSLYRISVARSVAAFFPCCFFLSPNFSQIYLVILLDASFPYYFLLTPRLRFLIKSSYNATSYVFFSQPRAFSSTTLQALSFIYFCARRYARLISSFNFSTLSTFPLQLFHYFSYTLFRIPFLIYKFFSFSIVFMQKDKFSRKSQGNVFSSQGR